MELGTIFAISSALAFAGGQVLVRKATHQSEESFSATAFTVLVGAPIFVLILPLSGEWQELWAFSGRVLALLAMAGIIHFVVARYLFFNCIRLIGANRTAAIARTNVIFSVILGVSLLGESVTVLLVIGAFLIMFGAVMVSVEKVENTFRVPAIGVILGLSSALCASIATVLVRLAMVENSAAYAATFVSYLAAFVIIIGFLLFGKQQRAQIFGQPGSILAVLSIVSILILAGHTMRYMALELITVSVVAPLMATSAVFVFILSLVINRRIDVFNWKVLGGILLVTVGAFLVSY